MGVWGFLAVSQVTAQGAGQLPAEMLAEPIPVDPAVRIGTLSNGVRYFIRANQEPQGRAELRLVVNAGSLLEDDDQRGLAHFVEHMAFNGTEGFERQALVRYLESVGMRFGPDLNAYTSFDETVYQLQLPTDNPGILETGVQILEEWAHRITFDPEEVDRERGVILEEWRSGRGAQARVSDQQIPLLFQGSRYAERLPIGDTAAIRNAPVEALVRFYRDWYRPDLMTVVAVGDFDEALMEGWIRDRFEGIEGPTNPRPRITSDVPSHTETLVGRIQDPELGGSQVSVVLKRPAAEDGTLGAFRMRLIEQVHDDLLGFRLFERSREPEAPFLAAGASRLRIIRPLEIVQVGAAIEPGGAERGLEALVTELERVSRHGFVPSELERQQTEWLRRADRILAERDRRSSGQFAEAYVAHALTSDPIPPIEFEVELLRFLVPSITLAEVNEVARRRGGGANRVILSTAPSQAEGPFPSEAELLGVFERVQGTEILPYVDQTPEVPLMESLPTPGQIVERRRIDPLETEHWILSNGVHVYLRPTDFRDDEVLIQGWASGGYSLADDATLMSAQSAATLVGGAGVGVFDALALERRLAGTVASVSPSIGDLSQGLVGGASPQDLETLFQLVHLRMTAPRRDDALYQTYRNSARASLAGRGAQPAAVFSDSIGVILSSGHPRARAPGLWILDEWDLDDAYDFYRARFGDASGWVFVLVGTFDPEAIRPFVEQYLASLPATGSPKTFVDRGIRPPAEGVRTTIRRGLEPQSVTQIFFSGPEDGSDRSRDLLALLTGVLEIRLRENLREDLSGTYGVTVTQGFQLDPVPLYTVSIGYGSDPARLDELEAAVFEELARLRSEGPSAEDLDKVREAHRRQREISFRQNSWWRAQILSHHLRGTEPARILAGSLYEGFTAAEVQAAAARFLPADRAIVVTLVPEGGER